MNTDYRDKYMKYKHKYLQLKNLHGGNTNAMLFYEPSDVMIYSKAYNEAKTFDQWKQELQSKNELDCNSNCDILRDIINDFTLADDKGIPKIIDRLNENNLSIYRSGNVRQIDKYSIGDKDVGYSAGRYRGDISKYYYVLGETRIGIETFKKKFREGQIKKMYDSKLIKKTGYLLGIGYNESGLWHFDVVIGGKKNFGENNVQCVNREIKEEIGMVVESLVNLDGTSIENNTTDNIFFCKYDNNKFVYPRFNTRKSSNSAAFSYIYFDDIDKAKLFLERCKFGEIGIDTFKNLSFVNKTTVGIFNVEYLFKVFDVNI